MNFVDWKTARVNGLKIKYFESGDLRKTPLVMIPGWPVAACIFEPLAEEIGDRGHCIGLNLPGFGGSEFDMGNNHTFDYYANFLEDFRHQVLGGKKMEVFGYSTGGVVAIDFSSRYPESLDKLIIFSAPYDGPSHWAQNCKKHHLSVLLDKFILHDHWILGLLNTRLFKMWLANRSIRQIYATGKYPKLFNLPRSFLHKVISSSIRMDSRAADQMGEDLIIRDFSEAAKLVRAKTLVMAADNDEAVPPQWSERLAKELLPDGKLVLIKNADHAVVVTEPEKIAGHILTFLAS